MCVCVCVCVCACVCVCTQVLGKRLGAAMKDVNTKVRALTSEQVLAAQQAGFVEVAGHRLDISELKVWHTHIHTHTHTRRLDISELKVC